MASAAAAAAAVLLLLIACASVPTAEAIIPELFAEGFAFVRDQFWEMDAVFWARELARYILDEVCDEKSRGRPLDLPFTVGPDFRNPITKKEGATKAQTAMWGLHASGRAAESHLCAYKKLQAQGRKCCCSGGFIHRCCCCCEAGAAV